MSKDHAHDFLNKLDGDADLRAKVREARDLAGAKIMEVAKDHGHDFSAEELRKAMHEKWDGSMEFHSHDNDEDDPSTCFIPLSETPRS